MLRWGSDSLLARGGRRCVARSLGIVQGLFGPQGFLMLQRAWAYWLDFSCSRFSVGFPISSQLLAQEDQDPGGVKGVSPLCKGDRCQALSCKHLQCAAWRAVRADAWLDGEPLSKGRGTSSAGVLHRGNGRGELRFPDACAGKTLPVAGGLAWSHHGSGRTVHFSSFCLVKVVLSCAL